MLAHNLPRMAVFVVLFLEDMHGIREAQQLSEPDDARLCLLQGCPSACSFPSPAIIALPRYTVGMTCRCHDVSQ
jgi:hypothetical protein